MTRTCTLLRPSGATPVSGTSPETGGPFGAANISRSINPTGFSHQLVLSFQTWAPYGAETGLVAPAAIIAVIALLVVLGLRDKVLFIAARSEQYLPALIFMAFFPFVDMIVAAKLLIVAVWFCAGLSKCNRHFPNVLGPMVSNVPWLPVKAIKRLHYANFPEDLRPSTLTYGIAHARACFGELVPPLVCCSRTTTP